VSRASTTASRLALALLAVAGFAAPIAAREADRVVQTTGGERERPTAPAALAERSDPGAVPAAPAPVGVFVAREAAGQRRYLLHRAFLI
jgi:hypothetical protein